MTVDEKIANLMDIAPKIERLDIPEYDWRNECLQGVAFRGKATLFPQAIAMAATWNPTLIYQVASAISDEARAKHHDFAKKGERGRWQGLTFSCPNINIFRDPRWGRGQETFGEDPYLTSKIGVAFIKGLQGDHPKYLKVVAEPKHFAVHSGPEKLRHEINVLVNKKDLYETYLPAFQASFQEGHAVGVMSAYNRVNGKPACASEMLIKDILRGEYGFEGYEIGDGGAVTDIFKHHKIVDSLAEAVAMALNAGCDIINPMDIQTSAKIKKYRRAIKKALNSGLTTKEVINSSIRRILKARFKLGMFDPPEMVPFTKIPYSIVNCEKHQELALKTAREAIVLLKNENNILPLDKNINSLAVIGPTADDPKSLYYYHYYPGSYPIITPLEGIRAKVSSNCNLYYSKGCHLTDPSEEYFEEAMAHASKADMVLMFLGITAALEGEEGYVLGPERGDRTSLELPFIQQTLLKKIKEINNNIVLILTNGSCLSINWCKSNIPAIIDSWYAGEKGGHAIADVIFGDYNPAGRLPITFYKSLDDLPDFTNYSMENRTYRYFNGDPLYSFGYGLSYTQFKYSNLQISPKKVKAGETVKVLADVKNIGKYSGEEVIQLYMSHQNSKNRLPVRELKGFSRIFLEVGETKKVEFELRPADYSIVNNDGNRIIEQGMISIWVGGCQPGFEKENGGIVGSLDII